MAQQPFTPEEIKNFIENAFFRNDLGNEYCDDLWDISNNLLNKQNVLLDPHWFGEIIYDSRHSLTEVIGKDLANTFDSNIVIFGNKYTIDSLNKCCVHFQRNMKERYNKLCIFIEPDEINTYHQQNEEFIDLNKVIIEHAKKYNEQMHTHLPIPQNTLFENFFVEELGNLDNILVIIRNIDQVKAKYLKYNSLSMVLDLKIIGTTSNENFNKEFFRESTTNRQTTKITVKLTQLFLMYPFMQLLFPKDNLGSKFCTNVWAQPLPKYILQDNKLINKDVTSLLQLIGDLKTKATNILISSDFIEQINDLNQCCLKFQELMHKTYKNICIFIDPSEINSIKFNENLYIDDHVIEQAKKVNFKQLPKITYMPQLIDDSTIDFKADFVEILNLMRRTEELYNVWIIIRNIHKVNEDIRKKLSVQNPYIFKIIATTADISYNWDLGTPTIQFMKINLAPQMVPTSPSNIPINEQILPLNQQNSQQTIPQINEQNIQQTLPVNVQTTGQTTQILSSTKQNIIVFLPAISFIIMIGSAIFLIISLTRSKPLNKQIKRFKWTIFIFSVLSIIFGIVAILLSNNLYVKIMAFIFAILYCVLIFYMFYIILKA